MTAEATEYLGMLTPYSRFLLVHVRVLQINYFYAYGFRLPCNDYIHHIGSNEVNKLCRGSQIKLNINSRSKTITQYVILFENFYLIITLFSFHFYVMVNKVIYFMDMDMITAPCQATGKQNVFPRLNKHVLRQQINKQGQRSQGNDS